MKSYRPTKASIICLVALSIGPLVQEGNMWRFDRRFFSSKTVNDLVALGLAVRCGNQVRAAS
jgi:hypothetical protein